jgi:hypothetical protein
MIGEASRWQPRVNESVDEGVTDDDDAVDGDDDDDADDADDHGLCQQKEEG